MEQSDREAEPKRGDEMRALETTLEARRKELSQTQAEISGLKSEAEKLRGQVQNARAEMEKVKAETGKLDAKRRDLSNLESSLESTRTLAAKAEEDLHTARQSLQNLHADAEKQHKEREAVAARLGAEEKAARDKVEAMQRLLATAQKSEAELKGQRSTELQRLESELAARRTELEQATASLAKASEEAAAKGPQPLRQRRSVPRRMKVWARCGSRSRPPRPGWVKFRSCRARRKRPRRSSNPSAVAS